MKLLYEEMNKQFQHIERMMLRPKHGIIEVRQNSLDRYAIGKIVGDGPWKNKIVCYQPHNVIEVDEPGMKFSLIPNQDILAFLMLDNDDELYPYAVYKPGEEPWLNLAD